MEKSMHVVIRLRNAYYQEYMNASQTVDASRLWRTCWHHLPLTVDAKLAASLSTENAANAVSSVQLPAAAGTAKTSQRFARNTRHWQSTASPHCPQSG